jgi:hypothetical protein
MASPFKIGATVFFLGMVFTIGAKAQDYQAVNGSPYAGSLGVADNPASILNTPWPWDITVFSTQLKNTTNAVTFSNYSYLSHGDTVGYRWVGGELKRYAAFNFDVHLLNVRLALGRRHAIAFGANLRGYGAARTGPVNYNDTLKNMNEFFNLNPDGTVYQARFVTSSWIELFGTYSTTLMDDAYGRLNAGATLRVMRGISGAYAQLDQGEMRRSVDGTETVYYLSSGIGRYGYSENYDLWKNSNSTARNLENFLTHTRAGAAVDIGFEYLIKPQDVNVFGYEDDYFDYDWKIGFAVLDVGANEYEYGSQSRLATQPRANASDSALNAKFDYAGSFAGFNDSLAELVNVLTPLSGHFRVWNPARVVINIDRPLPEHFALNTELTLNLGGSNTGATLFTKEITLLALTPRWETKSLGGYLPVQVTTDGRVWVGGAVKAGPLLLGVHNWADVFSKTKAQNGGFYLALVIRPGKGFSLKEDKQYTCPK